MSLLQIKRLYAPEEIRKSSLNGAGEETDTTATANTNLDRRDEGVFTCYFNRPVSTTDFRNPDNPNETVPVTITVNIFDSICRAISTATLNVTQADVGNYDPDYPNYPYVRFKLAMSGKHFEQLGGGNIYVHVVINNANGGNVTFKAGFSDNYHDTVRNVHIYDEKRVVSVCWSTQSRVPATDDSIIRTDITLNEEAYIHIRTTGLWGKTVNLMFYERGLGSTKLLAGISSVIGFNRQVVSLSAKYLLACYYRALGEAYNENTDLSLKFYVKAEYFPPLAPTPIIPSSQTVMNTRANNNVQEEKPFLKESGDLKLNVKAVENKKTVDSGSVFFQVNRGEVGVVEPERYRDFWIGYMCHIEGIGKKANKHDNEEDNDSKFTIYPIHAYKIMLSDLVNCGLVSLDEAIYLTTVGHNRKVRKEQKDLEAEFNKTQAPLDSSGKQLISLFEDANTRTHRANIRKVLTQVQASQEDKLQSKPPTMQYVCRDAWQKRNGSRYNILERTDGERYSYAKECPFGEFFVNKFQSTYNVYVSRNKGNRDINTYNQTADYPESPNRIDRGGIAFHRGGSGNSTGCITFNISYPGKVYTEFEDILYPAGRTGNNRMLNLLCIDERHAIGINPDSETYDDTAKNATVNDAPQTIHRGDTFNFYRFYDLIEPDDTTDNLMHL